MPIAALPPDTIRAIGASQVLTDSASVVKELVDNALDARSSAIFIEISSNGLDVIQVKDNGFGIAPVDRTLICKRYCTSKITGFEEIENIGGQSLGFRGEALASAAELSGCLIVSTRVEGESTAVSLRVDRQGSIDTQKPVSHAVGTTVRIIDFLRSLPVRRQSAINTYTRTLSKIKTLLQAYALARPRVRFSLKVIKAKTEKGNSIYAPKSEASITDAATKIIGKKVTDQCQWRSWTLPDADSQEIYTFECLLPKAQCDLSSINNIGQYLSVDSRPVSSARGTFKQITSLFKSFMKSTSSEPNREKVVDPFLCMNIVCPRGSYDANVEPAKDDVLFSNAKIILGLVEACFRDVYGERREAERTPLPKRPLTKSDQGFDLLLARKHAYSKLQTIQAHSDKYGTPSHHDSAPSESPQLHDMLPAVVQATSSIEVQPEPLMPSETFSADNIPNTGEQTSAPAWKPNMYIGFDDDDDDLLTNPQDKRESRQGTRDSDEESELQSVQVSNPWTIAKVNAPLRRTPNPPGHVQQCTPLSQGGDVGLFDRLGDRGDFVKQSADAALVRAPALPSPERTQTQFSDTEKQSSSPAYFPYPLTARRPRVAPENTSSGQSSSPERTNSARGLDKWFHRTIPDTNSSPSTVVDSSAEPRSPSNGAMTSHESLRKEPHVDDTNHRDFVSARTLPTGTPLSEISSMPQRQTRRGGTKRQTRQGTGINKPFVSPVNDPQKVWFEIGPTSNRDGRSSAKQGPRNPNTDQSLFLGNDDNEVVAEAQEEHGPQELGHDELAVALDYESRKADAIRKRKAYLRQQAMSENRLGKPQSLPFSEPGAVSKSPHSNRYNKAVAALNADITSNTGHDDSLESSSIFEPGDARAYLLRLQRRSQTPGTRSERDRSISPSRARSGTSIRRRKTAMLPLETISEDSVTRDLELLHRGSAVELRRIERGVNSEIDVDEYMGTGKIRSALQQGKTIRVVRGWEDELRMLVKNNTQANSGSEEQSPLRLELWTTLQEHLRTYGDGGSGDGIIAT